MRTNVAYNRNKDCLEFTGVTLERSLGAPDRDPSKFIKTPVGMYDPISREHFFEEDGWVPYAKLQKYAQAFEQVEFIEGETTTDSTCSVSVV